jgi:hypothetical protein
MFVDEAFQARGADERSAIGALKDLAEARAGDGLGLSAVPPEPG